MEVLNISQTRASRNLSMLYDAGFLKHRREGLWSHYSIDTDGMEQYHLELMKAAKTALKNNAAAAQDLANLEHMECKTGVCAA
jgi:ArsR family transcriptional regulator